MRILPYLSCAFLAMGCGSQAPPPAEPPPSSPLKLDTEPAGVKDIIGVREKAAHGDEVIVVGRVGGRPKPFVDGKLSFLLVDRSLKPSECECPWDYCDESEKLPSARVLVRFVDEQGKTLLGEARQAFGIKELSTVVVQGKVSRDKEGNVTILGKGLFVRTQ